MAQRTSTNKAKPKRLSVRRFAIFFQSSVCSMSLSAVADEVKMNVSKHVAAMRGYSTSNRSAYARTTHYRSDKRLHNNETVARDGPGRRS
jgi:hypothetical protein